MADGRIDKIEHKQDNLSRRHGMQPNAACTFIVTSSFCSLISRGDDGMGYRRLRRLGSALTTWAMTLQNGVWVSEEKDELTTRTDEIYIGVERSTIFAKQLCRQ